MARTPQTFKFFGGGEGTTAPSEGGASSWDQLANKPTGVFAQNGGSDGYSETVALSASDITGALGYTPADQAVQINAGTGLTGGGDLSQSRTLGIAADGVGPAEVDSTTGTKYDIDISGDADTLDGVEGSSYARTDVTETFNEAVTFDTPGTTPSGSDLTVSSPRGYMGLIWNAGDGSGNVKHRWDAYVHDTTENWEVWDNTNATPAISAAPGGNVGLAGITAPSYAVEVDGDVRASGIFRSTQLLDDSGYTEGLFGDGFVLKDDHDSTGRSYFEVDDGRVRGTWRVHLFKKDITRATNARLYVSDASQATEDVTTPSSTGSTFTLYVESQVFSVGDEVTFQDESGGSVLSVTATVDANVGSTTRSGQTVYEYTLSLDAGASITIPGGSTMVRTSGARMLFDASSAEAPQQTLWNQSGNVRGVLANLNGEYGYSSDIFGAAFGDPNAEHLTIESSNGFRLRDGNGNNAAQLSGSTLSVGSDFEYDASTQTLFLDGSAVIDDTITTDKITIADALTLQPGGSLMAGGAQQRFAFGNFLLTQDSKGLIDHTDQGAHVDINDGNGSDSTTFVRTDIDMGPPGSGSADSNDDPWTASVSVEYSLFTSETFDVAEVIVELRAKDGNDVVLGSQQRDRVAEDGEADSGTISVNLQLPDGTKEIEVSIDAFVNDTGGDSIDTIAEAGDDVDGTLNNPPTTKIASSTDFFGPEGAVWRSGADVQVEINGRGGSGEQTSAAGDIWLRSELSAQTVTQRSDVRSKDDVTPLGNPIDILQSIRGITYRAGGRKRAGIPAQDLIGVFEEPLYGSEEEGYRVEYSALFAPVIQGIKENEQRISRLEQQAQ